MADQYVDFSNDTEESAVADPQGVTATITAISKADGAVVTAANDFTDGDVVSISGVVGMTEINLLSGTVASASASGFTLTEIDSTLFTTYTSGGVATKLLGTSGQIRVIYDDTAPSDQIYDAPTKFQEWVAKTLPGA